MITENLSTLKIHNLTQAQYDRELRAGRIDENALYLTPCEVDYATQEYVDAKVADAGSIDIDLNGANIGEPNTINADTLGGQLPDHYATAAMVNNITNNITPDKIGAVSKNNVVNNFTTTQAGYVADARTVKVLNDNINSLSYLSQHIINVDNNSSSSAKTIKLKVEYTSSIYILGSGNTIFACNISWNSNVNGLAVNETKYISGSSSSGYNITYTYSTRTATVTIPSYSTCLIIPTMPVSIIN